MQNNFLTGCPTDCSTALTLPAIAADQTCTNYAQGRSQLNRLYIRPSAAPDIMASWATTPTYVAASIDNTEATGVKAHYLVGTGEVSEPAETVLEYPDLKTKVESRVYTALFRVQNLNALEYDHLRKLQCGSTDFTFYYADLATWIYGKSGGIEPESISVSFPKGGGNDDRNVAIIRITWRADGDPERRVNPLA